MITRDCPNRYDSDSTDAPLSLEDPPQSQRKLRPRRAIKIRRRHRSQRKRPESENISRPLSKSLDDIDLVREGKHGTAQ